MSEFRFHTKLDQTILLGRRARNIKELLEGIESVPGSSIYYHTHRFLQQHHYLSPEPPNDFAYWVNEVLGDAALGEKLSSVDIIQFHSIQDLRNTLVATVAEYVKSMEKISDCQPGQEFHFMSCRTFVLPTAYTASTLEEFKDVLDRVSINSIYFHMFDARLRLDQEENDFSRWFLDLGYKHLAEQVSRLDPYSYTLEGLRKSIIKLVDTYGKN